MTNSSSSVQASQSANQTTQDPSARSTARLAHQVGDLILDKKGEELIVIDVERVTNLTDFIVIASGRSKRQTASIADEIHAFAKANGIQIIGEAGRDQGWWVLVDFGDVVVHLMSDEARAYYDLEALWGDGEVVRRVSGSDQAEG